MDSERQELRLLHVSHNSAGRRKAKSLLNEPERLLPEYKNASLNTTQPLHKRKNGVHDTVLCEIELLLCLESSYQFACKGTKKMPKRQMDMLVLLI